MAKSLPLTIKESVKELQALQRKSRPLIAKRLWILIELKKDESTGGISKRALAAKTGINHNSINKWRKQYSEFGLSALLAHPHKGAKKSVISPSVHKALSEKLNDPENGLCGYVELLDWVNTSFSLSLKYITLVKYVQRHFGCKIKVARKSHIRKDKEAGEIFKKTLDI